MINVLTHPGAFRAARPPREGAGPRAALSAVLLALSAGSAFASGDAASCAPRAGDSPAPVVVAGEYAGDVFGLGRHVVVEGSVRKGVVAFGGDVFVRGRVEGDVAAIGGSVRQCDGSYVGGDVIVFGGAYHHGAQAPGRSPAGMTLMYAGYEDELRELARDPSSLLTPRFSAAYVGQRLLAVLFWLLLSLGLTTISPGAVSRAAARLHLSAPRVALMGVLGALLAGPGVAVALRVLPPALGTLLLVASLLLVVMAYLFGRVAIHAATGRWLQRKLLPERSRSEVVALFLGALFWSLALAVPYAWPLFVAGLLVTSLGLTLTARRRAEWGKA